jgi:hypothetical protein
MPMGQLNEHMPHCTQRLGSGVTQAVARPTYLALSVANHSTWLHLFASAVSKRFTEGGRRTWDI